MTRGIHWFRRDLRLRDNTALDALAARVEAWLPVFVFDPRIEPPPHAPRMRFLLDCLERLGRDLAARGAPLLVRHGRPEEVLPRLLHETGARVLSFNGDVSPFARRRDRAVSQALGDATVIARADQCVFTGDDVRTAAGHPHTVYSPYRRAWWKRWRREPKRPSRARRLPPAIPGFAADAVPKPPPPGPALELPTGGENAARRRLAAFLEGPAARYGEDRDRPDLDGTSRLSPHLRFGTISVRECLARAEEAMAEAPALRPGLQKWMDELVWREFYQGILEAHPRVLRQSFRREYDAIAWNDDLRGLEAWCQGRTGFPIVDAGMRQLRATGWMHNRVRMIAASFLAKDLLIDWRRGESFFFERLVDGDPASNNGGWQWAASTGTDAQPYFRIFNPEAQGRRWDPEGRYVRRWIPELARVPDAHVHAPHAAGRAAGDYPPPRVDHAERREEALARYRAARRGERGRG